MATKKKTASEPGTLTYKDRSLVRCEDKIYLGNSEDKYMIVMTVKQSDVLIDLELSTDILVELQENGGAVLKSEQCDGLYSALELSDAWLTEALA